MLVQEELGQLLSPVGAAPCLILQSGADEYVPSSVDVAALAGRLAAAVGPSASVIVVTGAKHSLQGHEQLAAQHIASFVKALQVV